MFLSENFCDCLFRVCHIRCLLGRWVIGVLDLVGRHFYFLCFDIVLLGFVHCCFLVVCLAGPWLFLGCQYYQLWGLGCGGKLLIVLPVLLCGASC